ncbi:HAD family hydrolase [Vallicoccus soli]|uniref:HAD family phosphatase n=1 Tax=Vallicoccus soli TaxID=2339232 RepID=A0A3A3YXW7_9ACTN|nr:HAD family phosphatase [Vallicoccus soli]RJK94803.1 HAD family phosphatase [Vallicoccus soli]
MGAEHPRVLVLDLGEVLATPATLLEELGGVLGVPAAVLEGPYWAHRVAYDEGAPPEDYWAAVGRDLGLPLDEDLVRRLTAQDGALWTRLRPDAEDLLDRLARARVRTALLSNAPASLAAVARTQPWASAFDRLFFSGELGVAKPDPGIYARVDEELGTAPGDVLFVDDREVNVEAARAHGWRAHLWRDPAGVDRVLRENLFPVEGPAA